MEKRQTGSSLRKTPVMGWTSDRYGTLADGAFIYRQAMALKNKGLLELGYEYIILQHGWYGGADYNGVISADMGRYPDIAGLAAALKKMGFKPGIHISDPEGMLGIEGESLKRNLGRICNEWEFEYISFSHIKDEKLGREMVEAIREFGRPVLVNVVEENPQPWVIELADQWTFYEDLDLDFYDLTRTTLDNVVVDKSEKMDVELSITSYRAKEVPSGHYYNVGYLPIGAQLDYYRDQAIFSEYCIFSCPLILSMDMESISEQTLSIITNRSAIAINQDSAGKVGSAARYYDPWHCLYRKELADGSFCFVILNRCHGDTPTSIEAEDIPLPGDMCYQVYDLWEHRQMGTYSDSYSVQVQTSDVPETPCCRMYHITLACRQE